MLLPVLGHWLRFHFGNSSHRDWDTGQWAKHETQEGEKVRGHHHGRSLFLAVETFCVTENHKLHLSTPEPLTANGTNKRKKR